ncbi:MAG: hypothetical protein RLZZ301_96 [Bacteroidota bacterium]|jgi:Kef-type K+ transport system membrane component KefB
MAKQLKFTITLFWILFTRGFDAYCTNLHTPDLRKEANPLVSVIGISSWTLLLFIICALLLYVCYAYYQRVFHEQHLEPSEKGYSFSQFAAFLYLGEATHWTAMLYRYPKDFKRLHQYLGSILTPCLVYAGFISTPMWLLIRYSESYRTMHSAALIYTILISGCMLIVVQWNRKLYKKYITSN